MFILFVQLTFPQYEPSFLLVSLCTWIFCWHIKHSRTTAFTIRHFTARSSEYIS